MNLVSKYNELVHALCCSTSKTCWNSAINPGVFIRASLLIFGLILLGNSQTFAETEQQQRDRDTCNHYLELSKEYRSSDLFSAEEYCNKALEFALLANDDKLLAKVYLQLGYYTQMRHEKTENVEYFFEALEIADRLNDDTLRAKIYNNIGSSYFVYGKSHRALEYFSKSLPLVQKLGIKPMLAVQFNNIGLIHAELLDFDSATIYYNKAVKLNEELQNESALIFNYGNIGYAFGERQMYDSAYKYYIKQKELAQKINDKVSLTDSYTALGDYFLRKQDYEKAIWYTDSSFAAGKESGYMTSFTETMQIRAEALSKLGRYDEAIQQYKDQKKYMDSIQDIRLKDLNSNIEMKYDYEQQRRKMELEYKANVLEHKEHVFKITFLIALSVLIPLIIIGIVLYLRYQERIRVFQNKQLETENTRLKLEAEQKSKNLTASILQEIAKNDVVNKSIDKLKKNKPSFSKENRAVIDDIIKQLEQRVNKKIWEEFKTNFERVHENFYQNLLAEHPNLTPNEKRLSAFIRLNLSSKDISSLTGQNVHSIEVARTRLRKKLNLANTNTNLVTFMEKF